MISLIAKDIYAVPLHLQALVSATKDPVMFSEIVPPSPNNFVLAILAIWLAAFGASILGMIIRFEK